VRAFRRRTGACGIAREACDGDGRRCESENSGAEDEARDEELDEGEGGAKGGLEAHGPSVSAACGACVSEVARGVSKRRAISDFDQLPRS
jgi:hypothetical protein